MSLLFATSWRQAAIGVIAASVRRINDSIDEKHIALIINQYIAINSIKNVVLSVGVVLSIIL